jgi:hypothetical protein
MTQLPHAKKPCTECPWRTDAPAGRFAACRYQALRATAGQPGAEAPLDAPIFACHKTPERFLIDAVSAGWVVRNRIPWWKRNGMRHPVTDRLVPLHETVFFMTPRSRYWFDLDAVREPLAHPDAADGSRIWGAVRWERPDLTGGQR